jgi:hypothetical protein
MTAPFVSAYKSPDPMHLWSRLLLQGCFTLLLTLTALGNSVPAPGRFARLHPVHDPLERLLTEHASRAKVERMIIEFDGKPRRIFGQREFRALSFSRPASPGGLARALALLHLWPNATYSQVIDDVQVLACLDTAGRLQGYELF